MVSYNSKDEVCRQRDQSYQLQLGEEHIKKAKPKLSLRETDKLAPHVFVIFAKMKVFH
jgi:hypothetical protein